MQPASEGGGRADDDERGHDPERTSRRRLRRRPQRHRRGQPGGPHRPARRARRSPTITRGSLGPARQSQPPSRRSPPRASGHRIAPRSAVVVASRKALGEGAPPTIAIAIPAAPKPIAPAAASRTSLLRARSAASAVRTGSRPAGTSLPARRGARARGSAPGGRKLDPRERERDTPRHPRRRARARTIPIRRSAVATGASGPSGPSPRRAPIAAQASAPPDDQRADAGAAHGRPPRHPRPRRPPPGLLRRSRPPGLRRPPGRPAAHARRRQAGREERREHRDGADRRRGRSGRPTTATRRPHGPAAICRPRAEPPGSETASAAPATAAASAGPSTMAAETPSALAAPASSAPTARPTRTRASGARRTTITTSADGNGASAAIARNRRRWHRATASESVERISDPFAKPAVPERGEEDVLQARGGSDARAAHRALPGRSRHRGRAARSRRRQPLRSGDPGSRAARRTRGSRASPRPRRGRRPLRDRASRWPRRRGRGASRARGRQPRSPGGEGPARGFRAAGLGGRSRPKAAASARARRSALSSAPQRAWTRATSSAHRQLVEPRGLVRDEGRGGAGRTRAGGRAGDPDRPVVDRQQPRRRVEKRRLARSVRPDEPDDGAGVDAEVDACKGRRRTEALRDALGRRVAPGEGDGRAALGRPPVGRARLSCYDRQP